MNFIETQEREKDEQHQRDKQHHEDKYFMAHADLAATMSYCKRSQVGAVIVKDKRVLLEGRNGTLSGSNNCCENEDGDTKDEVMHAEANLISYAARRGIPTSGAIMYCTLSPCIVCAKSIIQSGIKEVVYRDDYRLSEGVEFLKRFIDVRKM